MTPSAERLPNNFFDDAAPFKIDGEYCKLIPLTRGQLAIVSAEDYLCLSRFNWYAYLNPSDLLHYAIRTFKGGRKGSFKIWMHREILGLERYDPRTGDHVEPAETLDNRRGNIRIATRLEQQRNQRRRKVNTSGFKGVCRTSDGRRWRAMIRIGNGKRLVLGYTHTPEAAYALYCEAAAKYHKDFARLK